MIKIILLLPLLFFALTGKASDSINSFSISAASLSGFNKCSHYQYPVPPHFCVWISSTGVTNTTLVLDHYLPDVVVIVFPKPGSNPWLEVSALLDEPGKIIQESLVKKVTSSRKNIVGYSNQTFLNDHDQSIIFKEAEVIGNPVLPFLSNAMDFALLPSTAYPLKPYYQSMADTLSWRGFPSTSLLEETASFGLNVIHHIGSGFVNWGGLYPHEGKVVGHDDLIASNVIAQRAADLLTNPTVFSHIRAELPTKCGKQCKAAPITENSTETYFQMIYPVKTDTCFMMGEEKSSLSHMRNPQGAYAWIVWRHYKGCADGEGEYLWTT